jgi:ABC-type phosphate/phosphonate transport system substrate-binding protein
MRRNRNNIPPSVLSDISPREGEMSDRTEGGGSSFATLPLDLMRGLRFAYNNPDSMSGLIGLTQDLAAIGETLDIFSERIETGGHRLSVKAIAEGRADIAAIDCRSWALAQLYEPAATQVQVIGWTAKRPGLPYVTARSTPPEIVSVLKVALSPDRPA